jgi:two-component system, NtrC family, response regulator AtoC
MAKLGTPRLVLVATDESATREILETALIDAGYRVLLARGGFEAFELAKRGAPDIILVDADLPRLDGAEFCRAYRWSGGTAPVVLLSAAHPDVIPVTIAACGASAYSPKSFDVGRVLEMVAELVDGR